MSSTIDESEDVQDFLDRIKEIGKRRNQEDEERNRKLEEDIIQSKKERQARRAERARSISPTKSSPVNIPIRYRFSVPQDLSSSDFPKLYATDGGGELQHRMGSDGESITVRRKTSSHGEAKSDTIAQGTSDAVEKSSTSNIAPLRSPTLPWQRRPSVKTLNTNTINQVPEIATENSTHYQATPPSSLLRNESNLCSSRDQISQTLASSSPPNINQPEDQEAWSILWKNSESVENEVSKRTSNDITRTSDITHIESLPELERRNYSRDHLLSHSSNISESESELSRIYQTSSTISEMNCSPVSSALPQKLEQHDETKIDYQKTMTSPSQVYKTLERSNRSSSPTKGAGGFVQSAMMRRNDSVNKRWSASSSPNIMKPETFKNTEITSANPSSSPSTIGSTPKLNNRPHSSHGRIINTQGRLGTSTSVKIDTLNPLKSSLEDPQGPTLHAENALETNHQFLNSNTTCHEEKSPPSSPTKTFERRRWSPTKSSWLEAALNKPDFIKPKPKKTLPLQQPAWKSEINKVRQKVQPDIGRSTNTAPKHEVNIGGLMRSRPTGSSLPPGNFPTLNSRLTTSVKIPLNSNSTNVDRLDQSLTPINITPFTSSTFRSKGKFEQSSKIDFRANLKPCNITMGSANSNESELKNKFVQLRPTKTQNYVAPDGLKENITRGKASLNVTNGPQKPKHKDEFKEAILKKKEDFRKAKLEGKGISRDLTEVEKIPIPEALIKHKSLVRSNSIISVPSQELHSPDSPDFPNLTTSQRLTAKSSVEKVTTTGQPQNTLFGKASDKINPILAGLLAQGLNQSRTERHKLTSDSMLPNHEEDLKSKESAEPVAQLIFLTKDRARGPRRKPPSRTSVTELSLQVQSKCEDNSNITVNFSDPSLLSLFKNQSELQLAKSNDSNLNKDDQDYLKDEQQTVSNENGILQKLTEIPIISEVESLDVDQQSLLDLSTHCPSNRDSLSALQPIQSTSLVTTDNRTLGFSTQVILEQTQQDLTQREETPRRHTERELDQQEKAQRELAKEEPAEREQADRERTEREITEQEYVVIDEAQRHNLEKNQAEQEEAYEEQAKLENIESENAKQKQAKKEIAEQEKDNSSGNNSEGLVNDQINNQEYREPEKSVDSQLNRLSFSIGTFRNFVRGSVGLGLMSNNSSASSRLNSVSTLNSSDETPVPDKALALNLAMDSSDCFTALNSFFGGMKPPQKFEFDTLNLLSFPTFQDSKITTIQVDLFQYSSDGKKQIVPSHQERTLFEENCYLCIHIFGNTNGNILTEIFLWVGDEVPEIDVQKTQNCAKNESKVVGGELHIILQGKETSQFFSALGGIIIIQRGSSNRFDSLAPHILCARKFLSHIAFDEVDFSIDSLCSGFSYLIVTGHGTCYLWKGSGSNFEEITCAKLVGIDFGITGEIEEIEEGKECLSFFQIFGNDKKIPKSAGYWEMKPKYAKYSNRLFVVDARVKEKIYEIEPFNQNDLSDSERIYVIDVFFGIYIIIGSKAQPQFSAFHNSLTFAQEYSILAAGIEERPFVPEIKIVLEGIPRDVKAVFRKWKDSLAPNYQDQRGNSLLEFPLSEVLEVMRS